MRLHPLNKIRALRLRKNPVWTQARLARRVGCTQREISAYERGVRGLSLTMAVRLARTLGTPVEGVFYGLAENVDHYLGERITSEDDEPPDAPVPSPHLLLFVYETKPSLCPCPCP